MYVGYSISCNYYNIFALVCIQKGLRHELAGLYCKSLFRRVSDSDLQVILLLACIYNST